MGRSIGWRFQSIVGALIICAECMIRALIMAIREITKIMVQTNEYAVLSYAPLFAGTADG